MGIRLQCHNVTILPSKHIIQTKYINIRNVYIHSLIPNVKKWKWTKMNLPCIITETSYRGSYRFCLPRLVELVVSLQWLLRFTLKIFLLLSNISGLRLCCYPRFNNRSGPRNKNAKNSSEFLQFIRVTQISWNIRGWKRPLRSRADIVDSGQKYIKVWSDQPAAFTDSGPTDLFDKNSNSFKFDWKGFIFLLKSWAETLRVFFVEQKKN